MVVVGTYSGVRAVACDVFVFVEATPRDDEELYKRLRGWAWNDEGGIQGVGDNRGERAPGPRPPEPRP